MLIRIHFLLIILIFIHGPVFAQQKKLEISGLRIFEEEELTKTLELRRFLRGKMSVHETVRVIENFYFREGYTLVKVYIVKNEPRELKLFVDEGRLGKILLLKTDTFGLLWLRYKFQLKGRIFNLKQMQENMDYLRNVRGYKSAKYTLKPAKSYKESFFQLDNKINLPFIGETYLPFFNEFGSRYDLEIDLSRSDPRVKAIADRDKKKSGDSQAGRVAKNRFDFSFNIHYTNGFIPKIKYYHMDLVSDGDSYVAGLSIGIMYGLDRKFKQYPRYTFIKLEQFYNFPPTLRDYFTPAIRALLYNSRTSRSDLGILTYDYLLINTMFAPGITILNRFRIYTGYGTEIIRFDNSKNDMTHIPYVPVEKRIDIYNYVETGFSIDIIPIRMGDPLKQNITVAYDFFFLKSSFHEFKIDVQFSFELRSRSIYTVLLQYNNVWTDPPFHHEVPVSSSAFKGFMGRSYHSRGIFALSNEFLVSVYRDYIYLGAYFDNTAFQGSGYDLRGIQYGIVGGPTMRFLVLDQIEIYFYVGWDYLFSQRTSQMNFTFNLYKKW